MAPCTRMHARMHGRLERPWPAQQVCRPLLLSHTPPAPEWLNQGQIRPPVACRTGGRQRSTDAAGAGRPAARGEGGGAAATAAGCAARAGAPPGQHVRLAARGDAGRSELGLYRGCSRGLGVERGGHYDDKQGGPGSRAREISSDSLCVRGRGIEALLSCGAGGARLTDQPCNSAAATCLRPPRGVHSRLLNPCRHHQPGTGLDVVGMKLGARGWRKGNRGGAQQPTSSDPWRRGSSFTDCILIGSRHHLHSPHSGTTQAARA